MMNRQPGIVAAVFFLAMTILCSCTVSAVILPTATYLISFERNGTPACTFADFSLVCYGHSFLNTAMDTNYLNTTTENPVPLSRVIDVQVSCNPLSCCRASSHDAGDPVRAEWCELNGTTSDGDPVRATIRKEDLVVNCSGREYETQYNRCVAQAGAKYPCTGLQGSRLLRCNDARYGEMLDCLGLYYNKPGNQSADRKNYSGLSKYCEIRFNIPSSEIIGGRIKGPENVSARSPVKGITFPNAAESLRCSLIRLIGSRCD
jgi:hypothetical protein